MLYLLSAIAVVLGMASGYSELMSVVVLSTSGAFWYLLHKSLCEQGLGRLATLAVLTHALGVILLMAYLVDWLWFCAAGGCPLIVIALRKLQYRPGGSPSSL